MDVKRIMPECLEEKLIQNLFIQLENKASTSVAIELIFIYKKREFFYVFTQIWLENLLHKKSLFEFEMAGDYTKIKHKFQVY